ncbi:MAG TPA: ABC transporter ATP-binding protein [Burkholderiaceae bacterium]|nr:ABC transporter ATP-binding protein [Burkholderiaceae bacterium]
MARVGAQSTNAAHGHAAPLLRLTGITKRFGELVANDAISLELHAGEVLALLGENGAGKSTLVSILFGHQVADAGQIQIDGRGLPPGEPKAALAVGIGMVHQHFTLADNLSVLDNVMLGTEPLWRLRSRRAQARAKLLQTAARFGLQVEPDARIGELSVGERQRVEILKALVRGARVLILDEPTAVLTPQESASLFATLQQLVAGGMAIVFISHKLDEVLAVADRIVVLRAGRLVAQMRAAGADKASLAEAMVGRAVVTVARESPPTGAARAVICSLRDASVRKAGRLLLEQVNLEVFVGEVVAIAGVAGNGQQALADLLSGTLALDSGTLTVAGRTLAARPQAWIDAGVARIPEDRQGVGAIGELTIWENALLERHTSRRFAHWGIVRRERALEHAQRIVERFDVRGAGAAGLQSRAGALSGGNLQKLILGRALTSPRQRDAVPTLIVAHQPTWGLDVGALADVHRCLLEACHAGAALLLISEDLDEILSLADRIAVMTRGHLTEARARDQWTLATLGLAMGGASHPAAAPPTRRPLHDAP